MTTNETTPDNMTERVRRFFVENADEELTYSLMMKKFDLNSNQVHSIVNKLRAKGLLESVHVIRLRTKGIARD